MICPYSLLKDAVFDNRNDTVLFCLSNKQRVSPHIQEISINIEVKTIHISAALIKHIKESALLVRFGGCLNPKVLLFLVKKEIRYIIFKFSFGELPSFSQLFCFCAFHVFDVFVFAVESSGDLIGFQIQRMDHVFAGMCYIKDVIFCIQGILSERPPGGKSRAQICLNGKSCSLSAI